jgi:carboxyl-terminal processing protease
MQFKKIIFLTLAFISFKSIAQSVQKAATDAFLITRMAEKFHVQPRALDDAFSADLYNAILKSIDGEKIYFTQDDLKQLEAFKFQLDNEIVGKKTNFLQLLITLYTQRLQQLDTMADHILKVWEDAVKTFYDSNVPHYR